MLELDTLLPTQSIRWRSHDQPHPPRWHPRGAHEIQLIRERTGQYAIGGVVADREVVLHFEDRWLTHCAELIPELAELHELRSVALRGVVFTGGTAGLAGEMLESIGSANGIERVQLFFQLLGHLHSAPEHDRRLLSAAAFRAPTAAPDDRIVRAIEYVHANIHGPVTLRAAARIARMSESAFSRFFKAACGTTFSELVTEARIAEARRLLSITDLPVSTIAGRVGYSNLSNFNRRFRDTLGVTPTGYRRSAFLHQDVLPSRASA